MCQQEFHLSSEGSDILKTGNFHYLVVRYFKAGMLLFLLRPIINVTKCEHASRDASSIYVTSAGEVIENRSVFRHFREGGAILMVLVVFESLSYKEVLFAAIACDGALFQRHSYYLRHSREAVLKVRGAVYLWYFGTSVQKGALRGTGGYSQHFVRGNVLKYYANKIRRHGSLQYLYHGHFCRNMGACAQTV